MKVFKKELWHHDFHQTLNNTYKIEFQIQNYMKWKMEDQTIVYAQVVQ